MKLHNWSFRAYVVALGCLLIVTSENIVFRDHGDFARVVAFLSPAAPLGPRALRWPFPAGGIGPVQHFDLASYVFWVFAKLQEPFRNYYDLRVSSVALKIFLVWAAAVLCTRIARLLHAPEIGRYALFPAIGLVFFVAHNIGVAKSFYDEYCFLLFFPLLLLGLLERAGSKRTALLLFASLACAVAKVQYFYMPFLMATCLLMVAGRQNLRPELRLVFALLLIQALCIGSLAHNPYRQLNYHQSTYFGSYMELTPTNQRAIGLNDRQRACVGIDGWGFRALDPAAKTVVGGAITCYGTETLTLLDVLRPYLHYPWILPKLLMDAWPVHFTVNYFHVFRYFPYVAPSHHDTYGAGLFLLKASELRDKTITPLAGWILLGGFVVGLRKRGSHARRWALSCLFLSLFVVSQLCIGILGEGVRDLSKHWWAAQLALDALTLLLGIQACNLVAGKWQRRHWHNGRLAKKLQQEPAKRMLSQESPTSDPAMQP